MVIINCQTPNCANENQALNVFGEPDRVLCSGCGTWIVPDECLPDPLITERQITE